MWAGQHHGYTQRFGGEELVSTAHVDAPYFEESGCTSFTQIGVGGLEQCGQNVASHVFALG